MIEYKKVDQFYLHLYDQIPMTVTVRSLYRIEKIDRGLGGFRLAEVGIEPFIKDFGEDEKAIMWGKQWDISNWAFFMAFDGKKPIGGVAVASRTKGLNMLAGRDDLAVLWDIRVDNEYKCQGVGQALFKMAANWAREQGLVQMKIECQNNNVPAIKFYHKQGATLVAIDEYAYYNDLEYRDEVQLIWMYDL